MYHIKAVIREAVPVLRTMCNTLITSEAGEVRAILDNGIRVIFYGEEREERFLANGSVKTTYTTHELCHIETIDMAVSSSLLCSVELFIAIKPYFKLVRLANKVKTLKHAGQTGNQSGNKYTTTSTFVEYQWNRCAEYALAATMDQLIAKINAISIADELGK